MPKRTRADDPGAETLEEGFTESSVDAQPGSSASSVAGRVVDSAKQAASQAKEAASNVIDQAKDQATSRVDQQRETAASGVQAVAHAFRSMGDDLRNRQGGPVADYAAEIGHAMGGQVERLANYLRGRDVRQLVSDAEDFARRSPAVFLGSAFVLGLAASRFLKSSRPAPDDSANMPDPSRALPPASGTGSTEAYEVPVSTPAYSGVSKPRVRSRSTAESFSSGSSELGTSGSQGFSAEDVDFDETAGV
jgi:hypothetical protein